MIASFYNAETQSHISDAQVEVVPRVGETINGIWVVTLVSHGIVMGIGETSGHGVIIHLLPLS